MNKVLVPLCVFALSCGYSVGAFDSKKIVDYCTQLADCHMEMVDDSDSYDIGNEDIYETLTVELCVDKYHDGLAFSAKVGCKGKYKAAALCEALNAPITCDCCDGNRDTEFWEDWNEYNLETCWKELSEYEECYGSTYLLQQSFSGNDGFDTGW